VSVAIYARCSTEDQNPDMQLAELREFAERRGWEIYGQYVDVGQSGGSRSRPELDRLLMHAKRRFFDVVWSGGSTVSLARSSSCSSRSRSSRRWASTS
jgi:DNA invertase Pin-like site-specific DNA recombinase